MTDDWFLVYAQDSRGQDSHGRDLTMPKNPGEHCWMPYVRGVSAHIRGLRKWVGGSA